MIASEAALPLLKEYSELGFSLIRLHGKAPIEKGWPLKPGVSIEEAMRHLESDGNIGMRTGRPSGGIYALDVDHDWSEIAQLNADLLQRVRWIKTSDTRGRVLVRGQGWEKLHKKQPWGEILGDGHQCVLPPSIHPDTKKPYKWEGDASLPLVLEVEPEGFKFAAPLKEQVKPAKLADSEWATLKNLNSIFGCEAGHITGKEAYFSCPWHPPDQTASFSYNLANHKFSCFHDNGKLKGRGLDELKNQVGKADKQDEEPENFLLCDRVNNPLVEPEMIFPSLWPARTIGLFTGDGGSGKTHWALQLLVLIASGGEIAGTLFQCTTPRPVIYISQEDEGDFLRAELLSQYPELKDRPEITSRIRIISTALQGPNLTLTDPESYRYIIDKLTEGCVFVLDSWSTFLTSNENDNTELLRNEIRSLRAITKKRKATPFLIHHRPKRNANTGIQSSFRGGTVLPNNCRFHIMIEDKGAGVRLSFEKVSRGAKPDPVTLIFDEERKLFVPMELDRYVSLYQPDEQFTLAQFMERLGKDPNDKKEQKRTLDIIRQRSQKGWFEKIVDGKKKRLTVWRRKSDSDELCQ